MGWGAPLPGGADLGHFVSGVNLGCGVGFIAGVCDAPRNFSGYLYRSDNNPPQQGDFLGRWRYVDQIRQHWYFCISE